jgi:hypothetical protein
MRYSTQETKKVADYRANARNRATGLVVQGLLGFTHGVFSVHTSDFVAIVGAVASPVSVYVYYHGLRFRAQDLSFSTSLPDRTGRTAGYTSQSGKFRDQTNHATPA